MQYRPFWEKNFFLAVMLHFIFFAGLFACGKILLPQTEKAPEIEELEWIEVEVDSGEEIAEVEPEIPEASETFPEIEMSPIEIPETLEPEIKPVENKNFVEPQNNSKKTESVENPRDKLKVVTKVFPKDVVQTLINSGLINERPILNSGKLVIAITIDMKGRVQNIEIRRGGGTNERENLINIVSEAAAAGWTFEPYQDEDGNIKEMKTQIEFNPEDF